MCKKSFQPNWIIIHDLKIYQNHPFQRKDGSQKCIIVFFLKEKPKIDENKLGAIGNMLGCMFNPSLCEKGEPQTEQPDDEKEWDAIEEK